MKKDGKKNQGKVYRMVVLLLFLIALGLIYFLFFSKTTIYFYKKGTDIPIVNEFVEIIGPGLCSNSPCRGYNKTQYRGYTNENGAIHLKKKAANDLNYRLRGPVEQDYSYSIKMPHFIRLGDCCGVLSESKDGSIKTFMTEMKNPNQPIELFLGQEFFLSKENIYEGRYNTFQLSAIDLENETIELTRLIGTDVGGEVKTLSSFVLKKSEPAYIPGEVTNSTFTLESLDTQQVVLSYSVSESTNTWFNKEALDLSLHFQNRKKEDDSYKEYDYQETLNYFSGIEDEYRTSQNLELNLSPYRFTFGKLYAVSPLGIGSKECLFVQFNRYGPPVRKYKDNDDYTGWLTGETYLETAQLVAPCNSKKLIFETERQKVKWN